MKKLIIILCVTMGFSVYAQDDYGQKFKDYVVHTLPEQSRQFAKADYEAKWAMYLQTRVDQRNEILNTAMFLMDSIYREIGVFEKNYDSLLRLSTRLADTIKLDIDRLHHSRAIMQELYDLELLAKGQSRIINEIDSAMTRQSFLNLGMGHVGKERMLESIFDLGNQLGQYATTNFAVYITFSGDSTNLEYRGYEDEISGTLLLLSYHYPAAAPYLVAAYILYDIFRREENKEQQRLVKEGMELIDAKVIQPEEMYQLSLRMYKKQLALRDSVLIMGNQMADSLEKYIQLSRNFASKRFQVASQSVTRGKIKYIQDNYGVNDEITRIFQQRKINEVANFISKAYSTLSKELYSARWENLYDSIDQIKKLEDIQYKNTYYKAVIDEWKLNTDLIPISNLLTSLDSLLLIDSVYITNKFDNISKANFKSEKTTIKGRVSYDQMQPREAVIEQLNRYTKMYTTSESKLSVKNESQPLNSSAYLNYYYLTIQFGGYQLSESYGSGLSQVTYNNGRFPLHDIHNGMADGGFSNAPRYNPSGVLDIDAARGNITRRINFMTNELNELNGYIDDWETENINRIRVNQGKLPILFDDFKLETRSVDQQWRSIGSPTNIPTFQSRISRLSRAIYPGRNQVPSVPGDYPSLFVDAIEAQKVEQYRINRDQIRVRLRVLENYQNGIPDKVFSSVGDMERAFQTMNNVSLNTSVYVDPDNETCQNYPFRCEDLSTYYMEQEKLLRYHAMGWISQPTLDELSVLNPALYTRQITNKLKEFGLTCHDADPNGNTPCNIYTSLALKKVYGLDEFFFYHEGQRRYMNSNEIYDYLSRGSNGWRLVGVANNQENLDKAAFYANQGQAVVVVSQGASYGHTAIVMPSLAIETSTLPGWKGLYLPKVTSFFIGKPEKSFFYKKMSYAWSSPNGVLIFVKNPYE
ncbi:hypothetical protein [Reichenbachiella sp.]